MKLIDFKLDFNEKANRIGYATIETELLFGQHKLPFIISCISCHEQKTEKGTRRWFTFKQWNTKQQNERGYDIYLPIDKFKETHHHGEVSSWLWKEIDAYRATSSQNRFANSGQQPNHQTQPMPVSERNQKFDEIQEGVPF